jgi:hypothetical protein
MKGGDRCVETPSEEPFYAKACKNAVIRRDMPF